MNNQTIKYKNDTSYKTIKLLGTNIIKCLQPKTKINYN